jgi:two-component system CheB/CheR fusion protein
MTRRNQVSTITLGPTAYFASVYQRGALRPLVQKLVQSSEGKARAAFYVSDGVALHHVIGMPDAYARLVDGFAIGPQSLACGLAAAKRQPVLTPDVADEPLWKPWLWLASRFDYRACWSFPVEGATGDVVGTFAVYYKDPREATRQDVDLVSSITRAAGDLMSQPFWLRPS